MKLFKAMATVGGMTGISRIAGFTRDILTASILGAGPVADAFFVALKLPNFFRRVTAEGAFSVSFVPLYAETLEKEGQGEASVFASNAFCIMLYSLFGFTILAMAVMPWIIDLIAPGFGGDDIRQPLAIELSRITFPYLLMMSLAALLGGILNAHDRFAPFAAAPILFNLCLIGALLLSDAFQTVGHALAWGVAFAGILQFGFLFYFTKRLGISIRIKKPALTPRIRKLFCLMGPGVLGAGVMHVNLFADMIIASMLPAGSISYLYYADRLNQLPLGVVGIAVGTSLLPMLSKALAKNNAAEAKSLFNRAMEICLLLTLPAAVGLFLTATPLIAVLFEHGEFSMADTLATSKVLTAYAVGLPAYVIMKVYSAAYWARQDTKTPVKISIAGTVFNIVLSLYLVFVLGFGVHAIALATALAGWLQLLLLFVGLKGRGDMAFDTRFKRSAIKVIAACTCMAVYVVAAMSFLSVNASLSGKIFYLAVLIGGAIVVYGGILFLTGVLKDAMRDIKL